MYRPNIDVYCKLNAFLSLLHLSYLDFVSVSTVHKYFFFCLYSGFCASFHLKITNNMYSVWGCCCVFVELCREAELCEQLDCFKCAFSPHGGTRHKQRRPSERSEAPQICRKHRERRDLHGRLSFGRLRINDKPVAVTGDWCSPFLNSLRSVWGSNKGGRRVCCPLSQGEGETQCPHSTLNTRLLQLH